MGEDDRMDGTTAMVIGAGFHNAGLTPAQARIAWTLLRPQMRAVTPLAAYDQFDSVVQDAKLHTGYMDCTVCYQEDLPEEGEALLCYGVNPDAEGVES